MPIKKETADNSIKVLRHLLSSLDLSDVALGTEKDMTETERANYGAQISSIFSVLDKDMKKLMYEQLMYASNEAETWERVIFARGTFNGICQLHELWKKAAAEYEGKLKQPKEFDKNNPLPEL